MASDIVSIARKTPQHIEWGQQEVVQMMKTTDKLGFSIDIVPVGDQSYTIVKSKGIHCTIQQGDLWPGCRITHIYDQPITKLTTSQIKEILASTGVLVFLTVQQAVRVKHGDSEYGSPTRSKTTVLKGNSASSTVGAVQEPAVRKPFNQLRLETNSAANQRLNTQSGYEHPVPHTSPTGSDQRHCMIVPARTRRNSNGSTYSTDSSGYRNEIMKRLNGGVDLGQATKTKGHRRTKSSVSCSSAENVPIIPVPNETRDELRKGLNTGSCQEMKSRGHRRTRSQGYSVEHVVSLESLKSIIRESVHTAIDSTRDEVLKRLSGVSGGSSQSKRSGHGHRRSHSNGSACSTENVPSFESMNTIMNESIRLDSAGSSINSSPRSSKGQENGNDFPSPRMFKVYEWALTPSNVSQDLSYGYPQSFSPGKSDNSSETLTEAESNGASSVGQNSVIDEASGASSANLTMSSDKNFSKNLPSTTAQQAPVDDNEEVVRVALKSPIYVVWEENPRKLEIPNLSPEGKRLISFKTKVKKGKDEVYTLVDSVGSKSSANGILKVGDWIRSISGTPIHNEEKAKQVRKLVTANKDSTITIIVQRPLGLTNKGKRIARMPPFSSRTDGTTFSECQTIPQSIPSSVPSHSPREDSGSAFSIQTSLMVNPALQELFNSTVSKALKESMKSLPCSKVFVIGSGCDSVAQNMLGFVGDKSTRSDSLCSVYNRIIQMDDQSDQVIIAPQNQAFSIIDDYLARQVAHEIHKSSAFDKAAKLEISRSLLMNQITDIRGINAQLLAQFLKDGEGVGNSLIELQVMSLRDTLLSHSCGHLIFSENSQFVLTFNVVDFYQNPSAVMSRLCHSLTEIRYYTSNMTPIMLACFGQLSKQDDVTSICRMLEDSQILSTYSSHLVYNRQTSLPLFHIQLTHAQSHDQSHDIIQLQQAIINQAVCSSVNCATEFPLCSLAFMKQVRKIQLEGMDIISPAMTLTLLSKIVGSPSCDENCLHQVLSFLHLMGEIVYQDGCCFSHFDSPILKNAVYINKPNLISHITQLFTLPEVMDQEREWRNDWERLTISGTASENFLMSYIGKQCNEIESKHVLACLELYNLVLPIRNGFLVPIYLPASRDLRHLSDPSLNSLANDGQGLYVKFNESPCMAVVHQVYTRCMESCFQSGGNAQFLDRNSAIFRLNGYEFLMKFVQIEAVIKLSVRSKETELYPFSTWLQKIVQPVLHSSPYDYHIGPACPAPDCVKGQHLHVLDLISARPMHCGIETVDSTPDVSQWFPSEVRNPVVISRQTLLSRQKSEPTSTRTLLRHLPEELAYIISSTLNIHMTLGSDWRKLAALRGLTITMIAKLQTDSDPTRQILLDWGTTGATIQDLLDMISTMERFDVHEDVLEWIDSHK